MRGPSGSAYFGVVGKVGAGDVVVVVVDYEDKAGRQWGWFESGGRGFVVVEEGIVADEEIGGATVVMFVVGVDGRVVVVESGGGEDEDEGDKEECGVKKKKKKKPRKEPGCNLVSEKKKLTA